MKNLKKSALLGLLVLCTGSVTVAHAASPSCAFSQDLNALKRNKRFVKGSTFATFKLSRERNPVNGLLWVYVTDLKDTETKRHYQLNTTDDDAYDGGNTIGWIEDVTNARDGVDDSKSPEKLTQTGAIVAEISDSEIECTAQ